MVVARLHCSGVHYLECLYYTNIVKLVYQCCRYVLHNFSIRKELIFCDKTELTGVYSVLMCTRGWSHPLDGVLPPKLLFAVVVDW